MVSSFFLHAISMHRKITCYALVFISYNLFHFHPSSPCLKFQVTSFGLQQLKGLGLSSTKSDLKHVFEEICCWTTRLCGQIALHQNLHTYECAVYCCSSSRVL